MSHTACYIVMLWLLAAIRLPAAQAEWKNVPRVVAVGDVHGDYDGFVEVLRAAGVIDQKGHWIGGKTHLVQTGDVPDRGAGTRKVMDLLMELEKEAVKAGGRVHALIGNHEAMMLYGDLRYTTPAEFDAFVTDDSERVRASFWKAETRKTPRPNFDDRAKWEAEHPLGWFEHRMQYGPEGVYGKWIRSHNAIVKINDTVYLHGGISSRYAAIPFKQINEMVAAELNGAATLTNQGAVMGDDGPLWYRGLAVENGPEIADLVERVLAAQGIRRIVIGHSATEGAVIPRFDGKVVLVDVGLSMIYGGHRACLLIEGDRIYAVHRGQKVNLPSGTSGLLPYLKSALSFEPPGSTLARYVAQAEAMLPPEK